MKKKKLMFVSILSGLLALTGCKKTADDVSMMEYVPFQTEEDGRWGMVSTDGVVLCEDEFDNVPTVAVNGRFMVKNASDRWEIYATEKPVRKVGEDYAQATLFGGDAALVVRGENKGIELIDKDGKVRFALNDIADTLVDKARFLPVGMASVVSVAGGCYNGIIEFAAGGKAGCMNTQGKVIVPPEYDTFFSSGKHLLACKGYNTDTLLVRIFDNTGKQLHEYDYHSKNADEGLLAYWLSDGIFCLSEGDDPQRYKLLDMEGNVLLRMKPGLMPLPSLYPTLGNDPFVFQNQETGKRGLMSLAGDMLLRDKYDGFSYFMKGAYAVGRDGKVRLVDVKDNPVGTMEFEDVLPLAGEDKILAEREDNEWIFLDNKGQRVGDKMFYALSDGTGDLVVESDYVNFTALLDSLHITPEGLGPFRLGMTAKACAAQTERKECTDYLQSEGGTVIETIRFLDACEFSFAAGFKENICQVKTQRKVTYVYGWPYAYEEPVGYRFANARPLMLLAKVYGGRLSGRTEGFLKAMKKYAKDKKWTIEGEKEGSMIVNVGKGKMLLLEKVESYGEDRMNFGLGTKATMMAIWDDIE